MQLFCPTYDVEECLKSLRRVLESGWTGPGPESKKFEDNWSKYVGAEYSHYLNSATAALHIALRLGDLKENTAVLTTPITFVSTNAVILYENLKPVFVDINEEDFSLDFDDFMEKKERFKAKASMWVHYGGQVSEHYYKAKEKAKDLFWIEDAAHAGGASYKNGNKVGSSKDTICCFSYQAVKNLPTFDSGMICLPNKEQNDRARKLAWLGIDKDTFVRTNQSQSEVYKWQYNVPELGWKYNGNDIAAAIAGVQLNCLDKDNQRRKSIYERYLSNFKGEKAISVMAHNKGSSHHLFVVRVNNRDEVIGSLKEAGIAPGVHYLPNYQYPVFSSYYTKGQCPNSEKIAPLLLSLPNHLRLTDADIDRVSERVIHAAKC